MIRLKTFFAFALFFVCLTFSGHAEETFILTGVVAPVNPNSNQLQFINVGDGVDLLELPDKLYFHYEGGEDWDAQSCSVVWNTAAADTSMPGRLKVEGQAILPQGWSFAQGFDGKVLFDSAMVLGEGFTPVRISDIQIFYPSFKCAAFASLDASLDEVRSTLPPYLLCHTDIPGEYFTVDANWDYSVLDFTRPDKYVLTCSPALPDGFLPPEEGFPTASIYLLSPFEISLKAITTLNCYSVGCEWILEANLSEMTLEYSTGSLNGPFTALDATPGATNMNTAFGYYRPTSLTITLTSLCENTDYYFRIRYGDFVSDLLYVRRPENLDDLIIAEGGIGGDKDNGDRDEEPVPPLVQVAPTTPDEITVVTSMAPTAQPKSSALPLETVDMDSTSLSGARLRLLLESNPDSVLFEKHGIAAEIPTSFLRSLTLADTQMLTVRIGALKDNRFTFSLENEGVALPDILLRIPFAQFSAGQVWQATSPSGKQLHTEYLEDEKVLLLTINENGSYQLQLVEERLPGSSQASSDSLGVLSHENALPNKNVGFGLWVLLAAGCCVAFICAVLLCKSKGAHHE